MNQDFFRDLVDAIEDAWAESINENAPLVVQNMLKAELNHALFLFEREIGPILRR